MEQQSRAALTQYLSQFISNDKSQKIATIASLRTRHITLVLEELYQTQNASACLRSADCFGIQDVHVIDHAKSFSVCANIAKGSAQWLSIHNYQSIQQCYQTLRASGYTIVATSPSPGALTLDQLSLDTKIALVFGTERYGLSQDALAGADFCVTIPMVGFTQSLNVSVTVGLCLYELTNRLRNSSYAWQLSTEEQDELVYTWVRKSLPYADKLERVFSKKQEQTT